MQFVISLFIHQCYNVVVLRWKWHQVQLPMNFWEFISLTIEENVCLCKFLNLHILLTSTWIEEYLCGHWKKIFCWSCHLCICMLYEDTILYAVCISSFWVCSCTTSNLLWSPLCKIPQIYLHISRKEKLLQHIASRDVKGGMKCKRPLDRGRKKYWTVDHLSWSSLCVNAVARKGKWCNDASFPI